MSSSIVSSVLFLLLLVFSLHMEDASGAQTEIRKLKESVKKIRILEGGENRSSKTAAGGSTTKRCKGLAKRFKNMATTYRPGHGQFRPLSGVYLSSPCQPCPPRSFNCFSFSCVTTVHCQSINGSTPTCTRSEKCTRIQPGH
ncbi:BnaC05g19570D [Brassica napus]|uniref:BnaC05g19570D protein n=1 Tax=Brassica napus TaxID=3708 RepID=A0A078FJU8_BRANA|nr:BnaC05g19570D [Brassica napus]